ncbi:uncharacterized protein DS421_5g153280 [Arachis hypogaea]|nr:uncharacterized protein DS421_5g153280 [Arachis hypogaea]
MKSCSQEAALPLWRAGQDLVRCGAGVVQAGAALVREMLPCPRQGQGRKSWCARTCHGAARIKNWCARLRNWCARNFPWCMGCCPALAEGRAEKYGAARIELRCTLVLPGENWCARFVCGAPDLCTNPNAALPSRRAGQCFHFAVPCSKHGCGTRSIDFFGFLARHSTLVPCFFLGPCSILVACMGDIFPLNFFLGEPDTALVEGRARFSSSWFQGTLLCSALVVGRAELPSLVGSFMLLS